MTHDKPFRILFLCTGNSARSILAEYLIRRIAPGRFVSCSAGVEPKGTVHPMALRTLRERFNIDASDAKSEHTDVYKDTELDFVITVCDHAKETCPVWPGQPVIAHWGMPDPAAVTGREEDIARAFYETALVLQRRLELFTSLPLDKLEGLKLAEAVRAIGVK